MKSILTSIIILLLLGLGGILALPLFQGALIEGLIRDKWTTNYERHCNFTIAGEEFLFRWILMIVFDLSSCLSLLCVDQTIS